MWLSNVGFPLLEKIADFWVSRVELNAQTQQYEINGKIDEQFPRKFFIKKKIKKNRCDSTR